jgi:hypothetical protein
MITLDPPMAVRLLSEVKPGSLVELGGARGFCAFNPSDPSKTRIMVMYDAKRGAFRYSMTPVTVLDFGADLIINPNLKSVLEDLLPSGEATTELLLLGDSPKIVLRIDVGDSARLLDLKTGQLEPLPRGATMTAFKQWTVCIDTKAGRLLPLLDVGPRFVTAIEDDGPTEPDEV